MGAKVQVRHNVARIWVALASGLLWLLGIVAGQVGRPSLLAGRTLYRSGLLPVRKVALSNARLAKEWEVAQKFWLQGQYTASVQLRKALLTEAYFRKFGDLWESSNPPLLAPSWSTNIGHLGFLGAYRLAQECGLVDASMRRVLVGDSLGNASVLSSLSGVAGTPEHVASSSMFDWPDFWTLAERLQIIKTARGFDDLYVVWDRVMRDDTLDTALEKVWVMPQRQEELAMKMLGALGLSAEQWFVALHLRSHPGRTDDPRLVAMETYKPAVKAIVEAGGFVVRFGGSTPLPLLEHANYIDLALLEGGQEAYHSYLMRRARFMLTTHSGPMVVADAMGTPTVKTNLIALGMSLMWTRRSVSIPKKLRSPRGHFLSLEECLQEPLCLFEPVRRRDFPHNFELLDNSAEEILAAVEWMLGNLQTDENWRLTSDDVSNEVFAIQRDSGVPSRGAICPTFLVQNPWFV